MSTYHNWAVTNPLNTLRLLSSLIFKHNTRLLQLNASWRSQSINIKHNTRLLQLNASWRPHTINIKHNTRVLQLNASWHPRSINIKHNTCLLQQNASWRPHSINIKHNTRIFQLNASCKIKYKLLNTDAVTLIYIVAFLWWILFSPLRMVITAWYYI